MNRKVHGFVSFTRSPYTLVNTKVTDGPKAGKSARSVVFYDIFHLSAHFFLVSYERHGLEYFVEDELLFHFDDGDVKRVVSRFSSSLTFGVFLPVVYPSDLIPLEFERISRDDSSNNTYVGVQVLARSGNDHL